LRREKSDSREAAQYRAAVGTSGKPGALLMMKQLATGIATLALGVSLVLPAMAQQTADDRKWIGECIVDNKDEGQTPKVVEAYCTCMNNLMSNNERRSITQWERANPNAQERCSKQAGWGR